jgi:RNase H-like domain found in reverse transcriptase
MHLTRKGIPWNFTDECRSAFETLKKAFTMTPILSFWIPESQLVLETDTSDYALAVILSIVSPDNREIHLITFHSQTFLLRNSTMASTTPYDFRSLQNMATLS